MLENGKFPLIQLPRKSEVTSKLKVADVGPNVSINSTSEEVRSNNIESGYVNTVGVSINSTSEEVRSYIQGLSTEDIPLAFPLIQLPRKSEEP